jgi:hypothetical protein
LTNIYTHYIIILGAINGDDMEFLRQQIDYPKGSGFIIKQQYRTKKGDLYILCTDGYKWRLYMNEKKLKEAKSFLELQELILKEK